MHGCDQDVPDFLMEGTNGQYLLQFTDYLDVTREETIEHLRRRHLAYYSPAGHQFHLQTLSRKTKRSFEYVKWCETTLNFLQKNIFVRVRKCPFIFVQRKWENPQVWKFHTTIANDPSSAIHILHILQLQYQPLIRPLRRELCLFQPKKKARLLLR
jgi:hypothetical protein